MCKLSAVSCSLFKHASRYYEYVRLLSLLAAAVLTTWWEQGSQLWKGLRGGWCMQGPPQGFVPEVPSTTQDLPSACNPAAPPAQQSLPRLPDSIFGYRACTGEPAAPAAVHLCNSTDCRQPQARPSEAYSLPCSHYASMMPDLADSLPALPFGYVSLPTEHLRFGCCSSKEVCPADVVVPVLASYNVCIRRLRVCLQTGVSL